eukprot:906947-Rhodomonas_salina.1
MLIMIIGYCYWRARRLRSLPGLRLPHRDALSESSQPGPEAGSDSDPLASPRPPESKPEPEASSSYSEHRRLRLGVLRLRVSLRLTGSSAIILADIPVPDRWVSESYSAHRARLKWGWDRCSSSLLLLDLLRGSLLPPSGVRTLNPFQSLPSGPPKTAADTADGSLSP